MVIRRSFSFSIVRAPMMAGTVQPKPMSMGIKALPLRPKCRRVRSITKAARAIYPVSSSILKKRNRMAIWGRNTSTPPTPAMTPSVMSRRSHSAAPKWTSHPPAPGLRTSSINQAMPSLSHFPGPEKVRRNITSIMAKNTGMAKILCVTTASIRSVIVCFPPRSGRCTA